MTADRLVWAPPSWRLCIQLVTFLSASKMWFGKGFDILPGTDSSPQEPKAQSSLNIPEYTERELKTAATQLHDLLALLDESRESERSQQSTVETINNVADKVPTQRPTSMAQKPPHEQLKKKTMILQHGFTETAGAMLLGRRPDDEDAMLLSAPLPGRPGTVVKALFDGHGGDVVSRKCAVIAPTFLGRMPDFSGDSFAEAAFSLDAALRYDPEVPKGPGSTGIIAVMEALDPSVPEFNLHVANIGDSRMLVLHEDGTFTPMSVNQKPNDPEELTRVRQAGGNVSRTAVGVWRIDGRLALSRSFGDFRMKARADLLPSQQKVVALPHSRTIRVRPGDILLFACDGVFEAKGMTWSFVANYVAMQLKATGGDLEETAMRLVTTAYLLGSYDNISAMLVRITPTSFPETRVTAAEVDVLGVRTELPAMLPHEATVDRSGAWMTDVGLHATLY